MRAVGMMVLCAVLLAGCGGGDGSALTAQQVADQFKAKGMPVGASVTFTAETDPNKLLGRPNQYTSKVNFVDTRIVTAGTPDPTTDLYVDIEVFKDDDDAKRREAYIKELTKTPLLVQYVYRQHNVVLRLNKGYTPEQAAEYEQALKDIVQ